MAKTRKVGTLPKFGSIAQLREYYRTVPSEPLPEALQKLVEQLRQLQQKS